MNKSRANLETCPDCSGQGLIRSPLDQCDVECPLCEGVGMVDADDE